MNRYVYSVDEDDPEVYILEINHDESLSTTIKVGHGSINIYQYNDPMTLSNKDHVMLDVGDIDVLVEWFQSFKVDNENR